MLGPAEDWPEGSVDWALRVGNRLNYLSANAATLGVRPIVPLVEKVIQYRPWEVWPEPPYDPAPAGSVDMFFQVCVGRTLKQMRALIEHYEGRDDLVRQLDAANAEQQATIGQGERTDLGEHPAQRRKTSDGGNSSETILRRLARSAPEILAAYERGEFETARAAARAAGIKVDATPLQLLRRAWAKATPDERETFLGEICE